MTAWLPNLKRQQKEQDMTDKKNSPLYNITARRIDGKPQSIGDYAGKVLLIVNVASRCGFTPQYSELEHLYRLFQKDDLLILGFPCNQFGSQEPEEENAIANFCKTKYDISFPLFSKIDVNGPNTHPLYQFLKNAAPGVMGTTAIKWNFTKFLVDRTGQHVSRFAPTDTPKSLKDKIEVLL